MFSYECHGIYCGDNAARYLPRYPVMMYRCPSTEPNPKPLYSVPSSPVVATCLPDPSLTPVFAIADGRPFCINT